MHSLYDKVGRSFVDLVLSIERDQWDLPVLSTPGWSIRDLIQHQLEHNTETLSTIGIGVALDDVPASAIEQSVQVIYRFFEEHKDSALTLETPLGPMSIREFMTLQITDMIIHAWDLANALGQKVFLDQTAISFAYDFVRQRAEVMREAGVFGAEHSVAGDAPLFEKLLGLSGRDPYA